MADRTLVLRRDEVEGSASDAERLLRALVARPGVQSVRIELRPLRVVVRFDTAVADSGSLRALVLAQLVTLPQPARQRRAATAAVSLLARLARVLSFAPSTAAED